jgi:hypothetical protein
MNVYKSAVRKGENMKRPDLLILVVVWEFITAFLAFIGIVSIAAFAFVPVISYTPQPGLWYAVFGLGLGTFVLLCILGIAVAAGIGVLKGTQWGRILCIVHAALNLLWIPVGTVIGILTLIYMHQKEVKDYFEAETE